MGVKVKEIETETGVEIDNSRSRDSRSCAVLKPCSYSASISYITNRCMCIEG